MAVKSSFEKKMDRLTELSDVLDRGDATLDELLKSFEEGIKLYRECHKILDQTEAKIQTILVSDEVDHEESSKS